MVTKVTVRQTLILLKFYLYAKWQLSTHPSAMTIDGCYGFLLEGVGMQKGIT